MCKNYLHACRLYLNFDYQNKHNWSFSHVTRYQNFVKKTQAENLKKGKQKPQVEKLKKGEKKTWKKRVLKYSQNTVVSYSYPHDVNNTFKTYSRNVNKTAVQK